MSLSVKRKNKSVEDRSQTLLHSPLLTQKEKRHKKRRSNEVSLFEELITGAGYILKEGNQLNILNCDQAVFQKNLKKALILHPHYGKEDFLDQFIKSLENHIKDSVNLKWVLLYTQTAPDCSSCRGGQQDSLVRLLLNIDELQPKLITLLTEKLLEVSYDDYSEEREKVNLPRLILANLRWLDHVVDPNTLTEKVIDLLQGSPVEVQKEVINFVPNIVDDSHHANVAEVLCDLYESTPELTSFILDSLSYLTLESDVLENIHHSVLKTLQMVKVEHLPVVVKFLLHNTTPNLAHQVVSDIREKLSLPGDQRLGISQRRTAGTSSNGCQSEVADLEIMLFANIKMALLIHKYLVGAWLKAINDNKDPESFRPFDMLVLMVVYQVVPTRRTSIKSIFKNIVRLGLSADTLLSTAFKNHSVVLKEYFEAVKSVADQLIRSSEFAISHFGASLYKYCFLCLERHQQQDIVLSLLAHLGDTANVRSTSLSLLLQLAYEQTAEMAKYTIFLKGSLDVLVILSLREGKKLMEALIHLAHSSAGEEFALRDELAILTRKQLSHSDIKFKRLGVLSAVLTLKNSVGEDADKTVQDTDTEVDDSDPPNGAAAEAEALFHAVLESTARCPQAMALFMDELATNVLKSGFHSRMEKLISQKLIDDFEETFVRDCEEPPSEDFTFAVSYQWNLDTNTESEIEKAIVVGIANLVLADYKDDSNRRGVILTLAPHLRLMRMVESHLNAGELDSIDALLGCGVELPTPDVYRKFSSLSDKEQTLALSSLFYAVNWFRELVNAFVTQKDPEMKKKVTLRLRKIVELQDLLTNLLGQKPSYVPPTAVFDFDVASPPSITQTASGSGAKKGKGKTTKKKNQKNDEPVLTGTGISQGTGLPQSLSQKPTSNTQSGDSVDLKYWRVFFRELHLDVFNLLFKTMSLDSELDKENTSRLLVAEAEFLVTDLNQKLNHAFESDKRRSFSHLRSEIDRGVGFSHFDVFTAEEVAEQALRYIKPVCAHLETISEFFQSLLADSNDLDDAPSLFTERSMAIVHLFTSLFKTLRLFMSWPALHTPDHSSFLLSILKVFGKKLEGSSVNEMGKGPLLACAFRYLSNFSKSIINFSTAVELATLLDCLVSFSKDSELKAKLAKVLEDFLKKEWYTYGGIREKGAIFNRNLLSLLKIFFRYTTKPVALIHAMATSSLKELSTTSSKEATAELYPTMKKSTLPVYYSVFMENLVSGTSKHLAALPANPASTEQLEVWNLSIKTLHELIQPLKFFSSSLIFGNCLKYSSAFLGLFLRRAMPVMDKCLQRHRDEVIALFKNLQLTTRFLQHLCTHAKVNQDTTLVRHVPLLKKYLETILFRVKAMMVVNNCQDAFWMGNLKNRDLQGKEILSQSQQSTENEEEDEEEAADAVEEDVLSDVDLEDESNDGKEESYSVTY